MAGRAGLTDIEIAFVTLAADDHAATAQQAPEPLEMLLADDAAQVWGALGVVAIETGDGVLQGRHITYSMQQFGTRKNRNTASNIPLFSFYSSTATLGFYYLYKSKIFLNIKHC